MKKRAITVIPLLLCSVAALAVILERAYFFFTYKEEKYFGLLKVNAGHSARDENLEEEILWEHEKIVTKGLYLLDIIVPMSPLLGLFGTILGLIDTYFKIALTTSAANRDALISNGIAEALFSTLTGLGIAIPSMFFSGIYHARAEMLMKSFALKFKGKRDAFYDKAKN